MRWLIPVSIVLLLAAGCGQRAPRGGELSGTVTYKGQPVNNAGLTLYSDGGTQLVIAVSDEGTFRTTDVPPGNYKVVVGGSSAAAAQSGPQFASKPTIPFPNKYKDRQKTDLTIKVSEGAQKVNLELKD
jgi:hypothetical protein